jgi:hypothetical protein
MTRSLYTMDDEKYGFGASNKYKNYIQGRMSANFGFGRVKNDPGQIRTDHWSEETQSKMSQYTKAPSGIGYGIPDENQGFINNLVNIRPAKSQKKRGRAPGFS